MHAALGGREQLGNRSVEADHPTIEDHHAVAESRDILGLVGRQHHDPGQCGEDAAQGGSLLGVETGGGLVEQEQGG